MKQPQTWLGTYLKLEKRYTCKARQVWRNSFKMAPTVVRKMRCNKKTGRKGKIHCKTEPVQDERKSRGEYTCSFTLAE